MPYTTTTVYIAGRDSGFHGIYYICYPGAFDLLDTRTHNITLDTYSRYVHSVHSMHSVYTLMFLNINVHVSLTVLAEDTVTCVS